MAVDALLSTDLINRHVRENYVEDRSIELETKQKSQYSTIPFFKHWTTSR